MIPVEKLGGVRNVLGLPPGLEQQLGIGAVQPQPMQAPPVAGPPAPMAAPPPAAPRPVAPGPLPAGAPVMSVDPMMGGESPLPPQQAPAPQPEPAQPTGMQLGYRPGSYSPGGWRGDSRSTSGVAGQPELLQDYDRAAADAVRANAALAEAQGAIALKEQATQDAIRDVQLERADQAAAREQERQAKLAQAQAHVDEQVSRFERSNEEDPLADDAAPILLGIGQTLANMGSALRGRGGANYDFVTPYVQRKIAQQRASIAKMGSNIEAAKGVVADMRKRGFEQAEAEKLAEAVYFQRAALEADKRLAAVREPAKRAALQNMVAQYNQKALENRLEVGAKYGEKYTAAEKYTPGSTSGGGYTLNGVPVSSIGEALQLKKLMGQDSETQLKQRELDIKAAEAGVGEGGMDPKTVLDPQGRAMRFSTQKEAEEYRARFDGSQQLRNQVARLEEIDAAYRRGDIKPYEAQQAAEQLMGNIRIAIKRGVRGETDVVNEGERATLKAEFPTPEYPGSTAGNIAKGVGDLWVGADRSKANLQQLRKLTEQAAADAAKLANERGKLYEQGRGGRGDAARNLDLKVRK